ncbi:MAG: divergent polysaccharide deacetylase family protein [Kangiellaceae bacterium]
MQNFPTLVLTVFLSFLFTQSTVAKDNPSNLKQKPKIAIVIDDLGDNSIIAKKIIALPAKLTLGILPHTPHSKLIAKLANQKGHEIILHLPMEAYSRPDLLGPEALYSDMEFDEFTKIIQKNIQSIPYISGFNNHMGSRLTEDEEKMEWLMEEIKSHSLYFLDSRTSERSIAGKIATKKGIKSINRDIFLDHSIKPNDMMLQLKNLKFIANKNGQAVLICHPYPETLAFLEKNISIINDNFILVSLSDLL